jgi:ribosome assembly protein YihI (activator of Der GTPase)
MSRRKEKGANRGKSISRTRSTLPKSEPEKKEEQIGRRLSVGAGIAQEVKTDVEHQSLCESIMSSMRAWRRALELTKSCRDAGFSTVS